MPAEQRFQSKMKILQLNAFHYRKGGSEAVYFNTSRLLRGHGHEVINFALRWPENEPYEHDGYFAESKGSRTGRLKPLRDIGTYFYHREAARKLRELIRRERPDVAQIHLIWGQLSPSVLRVLKQEGVPAILTTHDYRMVCPASICRNGRGEVCEQCEGRKFYKCVSNTCCKGSKGMSVMMAAEQYLRNLVFHPARLASGVIYVSDFARKLHEKYMPAIKQLPSARIYNFTPPVGVSEVAKGDYILFFGRLSAEKGVKTLLEAAGGCKDVLFKIVGTGPIEAELKQKATNLGLSNVEFVGYKQGAELQRLVAEAKFIVVPSEWYENNPMTIIEAYAAGTPAIGAEIGGIPEIVLPGETGFRFKPGDAQSLTEVIKRALSVPEADYAQMCKRCREYAAENFSPKSAYRNLIAIYEEVIKRK